MGLFAWLKRLFGGRSRPQPGSVSLAEAGIELPRGPTAAELAERIAELRRRPDAGWPEIWQALEADGDDATQRLLAELRGPHLFAPHVALNVLEEGCRRALAKNPAAGRLDALQEALSG